MVTLSRFFTACGTLFKPRRYGYTVSRLPVRWWRIILYSSTNTLGVPLLPDLENPHQLGGCWVTLPNINLKHCLLRWKKRAYPRIMSIRRRLRRLKIYPVRTIAAYRRPGLYVGCVTVKYQNRSNTRRNVPISSTKHRLYGRNNSPRSAFRHPNRQNTQHFE